MTLKLRRAIETLIDNGYSDTALNDLRDAYEALAETKTLTMKRIEFLEDCLITGFNKRQAAYKLTKHDPRISHTTAETLAYTAFSGMYQTPRKNRRSKDSISQGVVKKVAVEAVDAEAELL